MYCHSYGYTNYDTSAIQYTNASLVLVVAEGIEVVHTSKRVFVVLVILVLFAFCCYRYLMANFIVLATVQRVRNATAKKVWMMMFSLIEFHASETHIA